MLGLYDIGMQCPIAHTLFKLNQTEVMTEVMKVESQVKSPKWSEVTFKSCSFPSQVIIPE